MSRDRFAPESYEDFICRGITVRQIADWQEQQRLTEAEVDELAEQYSEGRTFNRNPPTNYHE